jgi:hypothetical protein
MERFNYIYPEWLKYHATGILPRGGGLRDQPSELMDDLLFLDSLFDKILGQVKRQLFPELYQ